MLRWSSFHNPAGQHQNPLENGTMVIDGSYLKSGGGVASGLERRLGCPLRGNDSQTVGYRGKGLWRRFVRRLIALIVIKRWIVF